VAKEIKDVIQDVAEGPAEVSGDTGSMKQQYLRDLIALEKHAAAKSAASAGKLGLRLFRTIPPGAV